MEERQSIATAVVFVALASITSLYLLRALTPQQVAAAEVVLAEPVIAMSVKSHDVPVFWSAPAP